MRSIYIGFDPREADAFAVARFTARKRLTQGIPIRGIILDVLREQGLYTRPTEIRPVGGASVLYDVLSAHPMATEFAISRFLIGHLQKLGYAMFADCDVLVRGNIARLFDLCESDPTKAVWCVKHDHVPSSVVKMDGVPQTIYQRKNWSSVMVWKVDHPANQSLTVEMINTLPGRDLHRFCWLDDSEIGELGVEWNWLVGASPPVEEPKIVHFTEGGPWMRAHRNVPYADEWRAARNDWAA